MPFHKHRKSPELSQDVINLNTLLQNHCMIHYQCIKVLTTLAAKHDICMMTDIGVYYTELRDDKMVMTTMGVSL